MFALTMTAIIQNNVSEQFVEAIANARGLNRSLVTQMLEYNVISLRQLADLLGVPQGTANQFTRGKGVKGIRLEKISKFPSLNSAGFKFIEVDSELCRLLERELGI